MTDTAASPLESALLTVFHKEYRERGFPSPTEVRVISRENTGAGRYSKLSSTAHISGPDGVLDMNGKYIQMEGLPHGMAAVVSIRRGAIDQLEIAVYGEESWDGVERRWSIL